MTNDADVLDAINVSKYPDGQEVSLEAVFGNSMTFDGFRVVSSAKAFMQVGRNKPPSRHHRLCFIFFFFFRFEKSGDRTIPVAGVIFGPQKKSKGVTLTSPRKTRKIYGAI